MVLFTGKRGKASEVRRTGGVRQWAPRLYTAFLIETERSGTRGHFTRLHGQNRVRHVPRTASPRCPGLNPPAPPFKTGPRRTHAITETTDRKPYGIKVLVFRGKSHRNLLFYIREKKPLPHPVSCGRARTADRPRAALLHSNAFLRPFHT